MSTYPLVPESSSPLLPEAAPRPVVKTRKGEAKAEAKKPALAEKPLWPTPEEEGGGGGRRWLAMMVFVGIVGLYAYALSFFWSGAHAGVDQNGYLMTARLIAGDRNIYSPAAPAPATDVSAVPGPMQKWTGYDLLRARIEPQAMTPIPLRRTPDAQREGMRTRAEDFPMPSKMQQWGAFNWLRNRLSFVPETPYQFAGRMDIITEPYGPPDASKPAEYRVYAKYPFGYPLLAAIGRWIGGIDGMYVVNPLCTVLACYFAYFLFRQAVTPFMSLLGVIWLACNPLVLYYANDANSHASTLFCVTAGFWGVISWLRTRENWRAWIGGFALGYACTIRYSEFLLVLPVMFAALLNFRWNWKRAWGSLSLMLAWAIPIAVLAGVCWVAFGAPWKTGYTYCKESTGFAWKYLSGDFGDNVPGRQGNWETMVTQLNHTGLFVLWPLAIAGLFAMVGSAWRLGVLLALWVIPSSLLYMLYYWAPGGENTVGYMRFFMSIVPGLIFAGLWILDRGLVALRGERRASLLAITAFGLFFLVCAALYCDDEPIVLGTHFIMNTGAAIRDFSWESGLGMGITAFVLAVLAGIWIWDRDLAAGKTGMALGAGILTALGCAINLHNFLPQVESSFTQFVGLRTTVDNLREKAPRGTVIFSEDRILNDLDAVGGWQLINDTLFNGSMFAQSKMRVENRDKDKDRQDDPDPIQLERSRFYEELLGVKDRNGNWNARSPADLRKAKMDLIAKYLAEGRRVMFVRQESPASRQVDVPANGNGYVAKVVAKWDVPAWDMVANVPNVGKMGARKRLALGAAQPQPQGAPPKQGTLYYLWEITKAPAPAAKPEKTAPAAVKPETKPAATARQKAIK